MADIVIEVRPSSVSAGKSGEEYAEIGRAITASAGKNDIVKPALAFSWMFFIPIAPLIGVCLGIVALIRAPRRGGVGLSILAIVSGLLFTAVQTYLIIEIVTWWM